MFCARRPHNIFLTPESVHRWTSSFHILKADPRYFHFLDLSYPIFHFQPAQTMISQTSCEPCDVMAMSDISLTSSQPQEDTRLGTLMA